MSSLLALATVLALSAITPGPNNLVVLRSAARNDFAGALPAIAGVVLGSVALLAVVVVGGGGVIAARPALGRAIGLLGALYLAALGLRMVATTHVAARADDVEPKLPAGAIALFAFQFLNPKAWAMVLTLVAAGSMASAADTFVRLAPLFACIPAACLLLWAALGRALAPHLTQRAIRIWIDRLLGALLTLSACLLLI